MSEHKLIDLGLTESTCRSSVTPAASPRASRHDPWHEEGGRSSPRGSVTWVTALMNHRFVRSFSDRLVGGKRAKAERWWRKLRSQRLTGERVVTQSGL